MKVPVQSIQDFSKKVTFEAPTGLTCFFLWQFSDYIYKRPKVRTYVPIENDRSHKLVLLEPRLLRAPTFQEFNEEKQFEVTKEYPVVLDYENFGFQEVLKEVLPSGVEIPGGFEIIGNIVHLNLSD